MAYYRIDFFSRDKRGKVRKKRHKMYASYKAFDSYWNYHASWLSTELSWGWDSWIVGYENGIKIRCYPKQGA